MKSHFIGTNDFLLNINAAPYSQGSRRAKKPYGARRTGANLSFFHPSLRGA